MAPGTKICRLDEVPENKTVVKEIGNLEIQLTKIGDEIYAFENNCTHENLPMGAMKVMGGEIQCPRHGAKFEVKTGRATGLPGIMPIKTYKIDTDDDSVYIEI